MSQIESLLERIAVALEKIASSKEFSRETPFPWHEVSDRTRRYIQQHHQLVSSQPNNRFDTIHKYPWPLTCEALSELGRREIGEARMIGDLSLHEIAAIMKKLGFEF